MNGLCERNEMLFIITERTDKNEIQVEYPVLICYNKHQIFL